MFLEEKFALAIKCYQDALQKTSDNHLKMILFSNIAQNYLELSMYEDALENAEEALKIQKDFRKSLYRKATALAFLFEFESSYSLFKQLDDQESLAMLQCLQE